MDNKNDNFATTDRVVAYYKTRCSRLEEKLSKKEDISNYKKLANDLHNELNSYLRLYKEEKGKNKILEEKLSIANRKIKALNNNNNK